jgi:hypothetical protein
LEERYESMAPNLTATMTRALDLPNNPVSPKRSCLPKPATILPVNTPQIATLEIGDNYSRKDRNTKATVPVAFCIYESHHWPR